MEARPPLLPPSLHDKREHDYHIHGKHHFYEGAFFTIGTRKNYHYILETGNWNLEDWASGGILGRLFLLFCFSLLTFLLCYFLALQLFLAGCFSENV